MSTLYGQQVLESGMATDISLESNGAMPWDDGDSEDLEVHKVYGELEQMNNLKGIIRKYSIVNACHLLIHERTMFSKRKYWVHLACLRNKPKRRLIMAWKWLLTAAGSALVVAAAYKFPPTLDFPYKSYLLPGTLIACTALTVISLLMFYYQSRYCHVYYSRSGNVPFAELAPNRPDRSKYRQFREILQAHIHRAYGNVSPNNALAMEVQEHRRLNELGIITNSQYNHAKARIFKHHSQPGKR